MAEPTPEERDLITRVFLREYNRAHGTEYVFAREAPPGTDADWICEDPGKPNAPLKLQHVRAWADEQSEIVHPKLVESYVVRRLRALAREEGVRGYYVSVHVDALPKTAKEREFLVAHDLWNTITHAMRRWPLGPGMERKVWYNRDDIAHFYDSLRPYISDLEVVKLAGDAELIVGWSPDSSGITGVAHGSFRAKEALKKKQARYGTSAGDVVLIIDFPVMPYDENFDLPELLDWIREQDVSFREVWITNGLWTNQRAHRIWPVDPLSGAA